MVVLIVWNIVSAEEELALWAERYAVRMHIIDDTAYIWLDWV